MTPIDRRRTTRRRLPSSYLALNDQPSRRIRPSTRSASVPFFWIRRSHSTGTSRQCQRHRHGPVHRHRLSSLNEETAADKQFKDRRENVRITFLPKSNILILILFSPFILITFYPVNIFYPFVVSFLFHFIFFIIEGTGCI